MTEHSRKWVYAVTLVAVGFVFLFGFNVVEVTDFVPSEVKNTCFKPVQGELATEYTLCGVTVKQVGTDYRNGVNYVKFQGQGYGKTTKIIEVPLWTDAQGKFWDTTDAFKLTIEWTPQNWDGGVNQALITFKVETYI